MSKEGWNVVWSWKKLHKIGHSPLPPSYPPKRRRRRRDKNDDRSHVGSDDQLQRRRKGPALSERHLVCVRCQPQLTVNEEKSSVLVARFSCTSPPPLPLVSYLSLHLARWVLQSAGNWWRDNTKNFHYCKNNRKRNRMRWWSGPFRWAQARWSERQWRCFMARDKGKRHTVMPGHFPCSSRSALATNGSKVFVSVSRLWTGAITLIKKHCIPFCSAPLQIRGGWEPRRPKGAHFTGNEVLKGAALSLCSQLTLLRVRFLFDPDGAQSGEVRLGWAGVGAQRAERIVTGATRAAFKRGGVERPRFVVLAKRARAEVTEGGSWGATNAAVVPRTFPASCRQTERSFQEGAVLSNSPGLHSLGLSDG